MITCRILYNLIVYNYSISIILLSVEKTKNIFLILLIILFIIFLYMRIYKRKKRIFYVIMYKKILTGLNKFPKFSLRKIIQRTFKFETLHKITQL